MLQHVFTLRGDNGAAISENSQSQTNIHSFTQFNNIIKIYLVYKNRNLQFNYLHFILRILMVPILALPNLRSRTKEIEQPIKALLLFDEIWPLKIRLVVSCNCIVLN